MKIKINFSLNKSYRDKNLFDDILTYSILFLLNVLSSDLGEWASFHDVIVAKQECGDEDEFINKLPLLVENVGVRHFFCNSTIIVFSIYSGKRKKNCT